MSILLGTTLGSGGETTTYAAVTHQKVHNLKAGLSHLVYIIGQIHPRLASESETRTAERSRLATLLDREKNDYVSDKGLDQ